VLRIADDSGYDVYPRTAGKGVAMAMSSSVPVRGR
jgi:hypothetical protein